MMPKKLKKMVKGSTPARPSAPRPRSNRAARPATVRVSAAVEKELVAHAERYAAAHRTTLAALIADGLRKVTGATKAPVLPPGDAGTGSAPDTGPWAQMLAFMEEQQNALTEIRNALGDVAASLPADAPSGGPRPTPGPRIPPL